MKLTGESKLFLGIITITIVIIGLASLVLTKPASVYSQADMIPKGTHTVGNPNAKVFLVEFSDFQCPACLAAKPTVDAIVKKYPDKLLFAYRNFPLDQHPFSHKAAAAAEAAGIQGKYWEMYEALFANQSNFSDDFFANKLVQLDQLASPSGGLDQLKFLSDMKSSEIANKVNVDQQDGVRFGVNSTPSFFLNGKKLELSSFDDLAKTVDEAVANSK